MVPTHRARGKFQLTGCWTLLRASLAGGTNATAVPGHLSSRADDGGERYVPQNDSWLQRRSSSSVGRAAVAPARCLHSSICRHSTGRSRPNADERPRYAHAQQGRATTSMHVDAWRASAIAQDAEPNLIALVLCYVAGRWHRMRTAAADGLRLFRALPGTYRQPCDTYAGDRTFAVRLHHCDLAPTSFCSGTERVSLHSSIQCSETILTGCSSMPALRQQWADCVGKSCTEPIYTAQLTKAGATG